MKSVLSRITAVTIGLACALVLVETALRLLYPAYTHFYVWPPGTSMVFRPLPSLIAGVSSPSHFNINAHGIRGRDLPAGGGYRILAVGGSTTECAYLDDTKAWPALMEAMLQKSSAGRDVWVGNVGRSGMNSRDHVVHVKYLPREYPGIDAIVVLVGVNDLTVALSQDGHYAPPAALTAPGAEALQIRRAFAIAPGRLSDTPTDELLLAGSAWAKRTALYQLLKRARWAARNVMVKRGLIQDSSGWTIAAWRDHRRRAPKILEELPPLGPALKEYSTNLDTIVTLAHAQSLRLILLTQPTLWRRDLLLSEEDRLWLGGVGDFQSRPGNPYYSPAALAEGMRRFNETLLELCRARRAECIDLAATIPKDTSVFYDDTHFTEHGARLVAEAVAAYVSRRPPFVSDDPASNGRPGTRP